MEPKTWTLGRALTAALLGVALVVEPSPSQVLAARCRRFLEVPPPGGWNGTYVSHEK